MTSGDMVEEMARAIYARRPFVLASTATTFGHQVARTCDWDGAPAYYQQDMLDLAQAAATIAKGRMEAFREQTYLVDRLCSAIDLAGEDIGHESIDDLLKLIGPQNARCIEALGGRAALKDSGSNSPSGAGGKPEGDDCCDGFS
jgi:hypothetical protein